MNKKFKCRHLIAIFGIVVMLISHFSVAAAPKAKKINDKKPPTAPSNLIATTVGETSINLKWTASYDAGGVTSYLIYKNSVNIASVSTTSFTVMGLSPATSYEFYVRAKDKSGNISPISNKISVTTAKTPAPVPDPVPNPDPDPAPNPNPVPDPDPVPNPVPSNSKIIIGYYASWAAYSGYTPLNIPASKVTHINYAFAKIGSDLKIALGDPNIDVANFTKLNQLIAANPNIKTLISIGGWTFSDKFSDAALTDASRTVFADSVITFIKQYNFDGVDIDWEYPVSGGLPGNTRRPEDKTNFTLLMKKLREKLDTQGAVDGKKYLLSFAGGAGNTYINNVELSALSSYVDYAILMTYDLHGPWDTYTDFNAPLYTPSETSPQYKVSADSSVKAWISAGFPASKIVMGVPFYGYMYSGVANSNNGLYKTYTGSSSIDYDKIVSGYLSNSAFTKFYHPEAKVPYLSGGSVFISYDDPASIAVKANYITANNLAGASIWELSQNKDGTMINALYNNLK